MASTLVNISDVRRVSESSTEESCEPQAPPNAKPLTMSDQYNKPK